MWYLLSVKTVPRVCPVCSKDYMADPARLAIGRQTTCSRGCSYALRAQGLSASTVTRCPVCEKDFELAPSHAAKAKHGTSFCSKDCHYRGRTLGLTKRTVTRPYVYTMEGKTAMLAASNTPKGQRVFHPVNCTMCKVEFDDPTDGRVRLSGWVFCSLKCCNRYRRGPNNPAWRGGHSKYYGPDWRPVRKAARERDKVCRRCGAPPTTRQLDVHHIIPVGSFPNQNDANTMDNVVAVCHLCHMFVEWNGMDFTP